MNRIQQSFFISFVFLTIYQVFLIIKYIYIEKNYSIQLSFDMIPLEYYVSNMVIFTAMLILILLIILNIKKIIKYLNTKKEKELFNDDRVGLLKVFTAFILLEVIAFIYMINMKLLETIDQVLNLYWLEKGIRGLQTNTDEIQSQLLIQDYIFLIIPFLIFILIRFNTYKKVYKILRNIIIISVTIMLSLYLYFENGTEKKLTSMSSDILNPILSIIQDIDKKFTIENKVPKIYFNEEQRKSIKIISEELLKNSNEYIKLTDNKNIPKNILFILMESVGKDSVFKTKENTNDITAPMPFLYKLSKEGVWFENAYSNAALTGQAVFGITTGLNVYTGSETVYSKTLKFPTINNIVKNYDIFFEHASNMRTWFPKPLLEYNNMELIDMNDLKDKYPVIKRLAIEEEPAIMDFTDRFIKKIKQGKNTIGFYLNYNTHYPYFSYGEGIYNADEDKKEELEKNSNSHINKNNYYKSLNYLDLKIKQVFEKLKKEKVLDKTIVIIMGDHGQSFGQHGVWSHGEVYDNIARIPILIWQPNYIKAQVYKAYVSQADIMPTILDLLKQKYDSNKIQGISLLKTEKRKYIYSRQKSHQILDTGSEIKMILSSDLSSCNVFDLKNDKAEIKKLDCEKYSELKKILYKYINYQSEILLKYKLNIDDNDKK